MLNNIIIWTLCALAAVLLVILLTKCLLTYNRTNDAESTQTLNTALSSSSNDVTSILEDLGMPFSKAGYARNVWDMQVFNGRIYLGHGNSSNQAPNLNAGPIPVIYYDPVQKKFVTQYTVNEEQIDIYKILDGKLYIPGNDPRDTWNLGNFYRMDNDEWTKVRTIPKGIHNFDMEFLNGKIFTAIGTTENKTVFMSGDGGNTWTTVAPKSGIKYYAYGARTYTLINFNSQIYAVSVLFNSDYYEIIPGVKIPVDINNCVMITDGSSCVAQKIPIGKMLPSAPPNKPYKLVRVVVGLRNMIYIAGEVNNDEQWLPEGLYYAPALNQAKRVVFPEKLALPMDILLRDNKIYVLASIRTSAGSYINIIYKTEDLIQWTELLRFNYDTFARSFEELNGDFYFGMGCNTKIISKSTGKILKVKKI